MHVVLVVPVKRLAVAKTRLADRWGDRRTALALAFACDVVEVALSVPDLDVVVVTDEPTAADEMRRLGAAVVADAPDAGLNPALVHGAVEARRLFPGVVVGAMSADLPALRASDLAVAIDEAATHPGGAFVADAAGDGTTLLVGGASETLRPRFGHGSAAAHLADGLHGVVASVPTLRRDVDTPADLDTAIAMGVGPRTTRVLRDAR